MVEWSNISVLLLVFYIIFIVFLYEIFPKGELLFEVFIIFVLRPDFRTVVFTGTSSEEFAK